MNSISLNVLNNYLDRAVTYNLLTDGGPVDIIKYDADHADEAIRFITNVGAKYIQRAAGVWFPNGKRVNAVCALKESIDKAHIIDPDIVFEAGIFETTLWDIQDILIPNYVLKAFEQPITTRYFNVNNIRFLDDYGKNKWGSGFHIPDITRVETQMFIYCLATRYIDAGFEALHLGQVDLIGRSDTNNACLTKVINMIRQYASEHARRGYVLINAHSSNAKYLGTDGNMLWDMIVAPSRVHAPAGSVYHEPAEGNPQICIIEKGYWGNSIYQSGVSGRSPSGWYAEKYPYLVEFDNYGVNISGTPKATDYVWGTDEISWYVRQPASYRRKFMKDIKAQINSFNENGHIAFVGHRGGTYYANNNSSACPNGSNDETYIKNLFNN